MHFPVRKYCPSDYHLIKISFSAIFHFHLLTPFHVVPLTLSVHIPSYNYHVLLVYLLSVTSMTYCKCVAKYGHGVMQNHEVQVRRRVFALFPSPFLC